MKKIFIDCGGHKGESVSYFLRNQPKSEEFKIFSFEPNKESIKKYDHYDNLTILNNVVGVEEKNILFYQDDKYTCGASKFKSKFNSTDKSKLITKELKMISLNKWIERNTEEDDYIILKMDIEGSEYEVLEDLIENKTINRINKLYIEWHCRKIKEISANTHITLLEKLAEVKLIPYHWNAFGKNRQKVGTCLGKKIAIKPNKIHNNLSSEMKKRLDRVCLRYLEIDKSADASRLKK